MSDVQKPIREKTCPRCGSSFGCGPGADPSGLGCWCDGLPALVARSGEDCMCPACLREAVGREQMA